MSKKYEFTETRTFSWYMTSFIGELAANAYNAGQANVDVKVIDLLVEKTMKELQELGKQHFASKYGEINNTDLTVEEANAQA